MAQRTPHRNSMDTILTFDNRDNQSEWSVEWSTSNVPGMDMAAGTAPRRDRGRRRLRLSALALSSCLTMHCRVVGPALTTGLLYYLFLVAAVVVLANPLRHFEVYLGQWSISGPGRAFRVIPMLDGIGLAMCITSIVRAINYCTMAAITMLYVVHSMSDSKLPFTYCRNWDLQPYKPTIENTSVYALSGRRFMECNENSKICRYTTVGLRFRAWRGGGSSQGMKFELLKCNETYPGPYPFFYSPPPYNYFYLELVRMPLTYHFGAFNIPLLICLGCIWVLMWFLMIAERVRHRRLVWNNLYPWIVVVPWIWVVCLAVVASMTVSAPKRVIKQIFKLGKIDIFSGLTDAFVVSLYIHSAGTGTEIIHGKGLNHYASGHIDPLLNADNVWHSGIVLALAVLHAAAATVCAVGDVSHLDVANVYDTRESVMWVIPMYSKCTAQGNYSHTMSTIIFGGLTFSYIVVAYTLIKTALHTIFEYKVKLVFVEQQVVLAMICSCFLLSLPYATFGGLALLESVDSLMTGVALPSVCLVELAALVYLYRSPDFRSDLNIATEENTCNSRISTSWTFIPFVVLVVLIGQIISVSQTELPSLAMYTALAPLLAAALAVPLRALHNAIVFMHPAPRRGV
ncbi:sodium- and chloride-dependent neutral and basic amino acid transporter B(0+)-like isoform X1 [Cydia amplana]|uniref:sodium- and chloride-dependent neutral and basic amino acid transporter B(0+)-like isoform X1 n=1 Tax=Cydia amplana TaxID=1869771 RepID=UPI002FE64EC2